MVASAASLVLTDADHNPVFSFHLNADPDSASKNDMDPGQQHCFYSPFMFHLSVQLGLPLFFLPLALAPRP
jgi:hypothetical protein